MTLRISGTTRIAGLFGFPVSHSLSPAMHAAAYNAMALNWAYIPFNVDPLHIPQAVASIRALNLVGVNVTVPHKSAVIDHLDFVDEAASRINSVNTIHNIDGQLYGYSTDGPGFLDTLAANNVEVAGKSVLVLGAGGSASAIVFALAEAGANVVLSNRTRSRAQDIAHSVNHYYHGKVTVTDPGHDCGPIDIIVNTTTLGMSSAISDVPTLPPGMPNAAQTVYDIIYNPLETPLLKLARQSGTRTLNGAGMLARQGARSISVWTGIPIQEIPAELMENVVLDALKPG